MHNKSEGFATFLKFKAHAENLFSCSKKQFQTDNGGECSSKQFSEFLSKFGIYHRLTCPRTSQQNGIAERKHCHFQELDLTLLVQSHHKQNFWVDAFQTIVHLINRLPAHQSSTKSQSF